MDSTVCWFGVGFLPRLIRRCCRGFLTNDFKRLSLAIIWFETNWNNAICSDLEFNE